jgi:hypothetical protein
MPTPEELLEALETRLILGEISEARYDEFRAKLEVSPAVQVGEGSVVKVNIDASPPGHPGTYTRNQISYQLRE